MSQTHRPIVHSAGNFASNAFDEPNSTSSTRTARTQARDVTKAKQMERDEAKKAAAHQKRLLQKQEEELNQFNANASALNQTVMAGTASNGGSGRDNGFLLATVSAVDARIGNHQLENGQQPPVSSTAQKVSTSQHQASWNASAIGEMEQTVIYNPKSKTIDDELVDMANAQLAAANALSETMQIARQGSMLTKRTPLPNRVSSRNSRQPEEEGRRESLSVQLLDSAGNSELERLKVVENSSESESEKSNRRINNTPVLLHATGFAAELLHSVANQPPARKLITNMLYGLESELGAITLNGTMKEDEKDYQSRNVVCNGVVALVTRLAAINEELAADQAFQDREIRNTKKDILKLECRSELFREQRDKALTIAKKAEQTITQFTSEVTHQRRITSEQLMVAVTEKERLGKDLVVSKAFIRELKASINDLQARNIKGETDRNFVLEEYEAMQKQCAQTERTLELASTRAMTAESIVEQLKLELEGMKQSRNWNGKVNFAVPNSEGNSSTIKVPTRNNNVPTRQTSHQCSSSTRCNSGGTGKFSNQDVRRRDESVSKHRSRSRGRSDKKKVSKKGSDPDSSDSSDSNDDDKRGKKRSASRGGDKKKPRRHDKSRKRNESESGSGSESGSESDDDDDTIVSAGLQTHHMDPSKFKPATDDIHVWIQQYKVAATCNGWKSDRMKVMAMLRYLDTEANAHVQKYISGLKGGKPVFKDAIHSLKRLYTKTPNQERVEATRKLANRVLKQGEPPRSLFHDLEELVKLVDEKPSPHTMYNALYNALRVDTWLQKQAYAADIDHNWKHAKKWAERKIETRRKMLEHDKANGVHIPDNIANLYCIGDATNALQIDAIAAAEDEDDEDNASNTGAKIHVRPQVIAKEKTKTTKKKSTAEPAVQTLNFVHSFADVRNEQNGNGNGNGRPRSNSPFDNRARTNSVDRLSQQRPQSPGGLRGCYICGEPCHFAKECPYRDDQRPVTMACSGCGGNHQLWVCDKKLCVYCKKNGKKADGHLQQECKEYLSIPAADPAQKRLNDMFLRGLIRKEKEASTAARPVTVPVGGTASVQMTLVNGQGKTDASTRRMASVANDDDVASDSKNY